MRGEEGAASEVVVVTYSTLPEPAAREGEREGSYHDDTCQLYVVQ